MKTHSFPAIGPAGAASAALEWVVLNGRDEADRAWIETQSRFDDAVKAMLSTPPTRSDHAHLDTAIVLTLVRADDATGDVPIGLSIVVEAQRVVIVCFGTDAIVGEAFERETGRASAMSTARALSLLVVALLKQLQPEISPLADRLDELEDAAMRESEQTSDDDVVRAGQQILALRRYLAPLHYELSYLALNPDELPGAADPRHLRRAAESLARLMSGLEASHHRVQLILSQLRNRDSSRLEKTIHQLTLVATVFLPLSFVTGLLGINVAGVPGSHDPFAFWVVCGVLIAIAIGAIVLIRWRKWM